MFISNKPGTKRNELEKLATQSTENALKHIKISFRNSRYWEKEPKEEKLQNKQCIWLKRTKKIRFYESSINNLHQMCQKSSDA